MTIDKPTPSQIPALKELWKTVFGDTDAFIELFFQIAFSPERCLCVLADEKPLSVVYWFDTQFNGKKLAYLYAIATAPEHRKKGYCRELIAYTHKHLQDLDYAGTLLVPAKESLFRMYEAMGYKACCYHRTFSRYTPGEPTPLTKLTGAQYAAMRESLLPFGSVRQDGPMWELIEKTLEFYQSDTNIFACYREGKTVFVPEILGPAPHPEKLIAGLGCTEGHFRTPSHQTPFAMYHPLGKAISFPPNYLGFALD